jgi:hypothetical protein
MPLESATTISSLDSSWPLGGDPANQGDDHLRLIKAVLKAQFPGAGAAGFNTPINATEAELNALVGYNTASSIETRFTTLEASVTALQAALNAPAGTKMLFPQAAAPTGWTQDVSLNDYMLRVVNTAGAGTGGSDSPILNSKVASHTHTFSATTGTGGGSHSHTVSINMYQACAASSGCYGGGPIGSCNGFCSTTSSHSSASSTNINHTHSVSGTTATNGSASNWTPKYVNTIIATKD